MYTLIRLFDPRKEDTLLSVFTVADTATLLYETVVDYVKQRKTEPRNDNTIYEDFATSSYVLENGKAVLQRLDKWLCDYDDGLK